MEITGFSAYLRSLVLLFLLSIGLSSCYSVRLLSRDGIPEPDLTNDDQDFYRNKKVFVIDTTINLKATAGSYSLIRNCGPSGFYAVAFTKFPVTCMLEIDGINWDAKGQGMISLEQFCTRMIEVLQENGIPFSLHWGKNADWGFPGLVKHMFGDRVEEWKTERKKLLSPEMELLFANGFLEVADLI